MSIIDSLNWRYATTKFDRNKKISDSDILKLKEIVKLSPSSWGLQFYKILIFSSQDIKDKLLPAAYSQKQVADCSHLFVFCSLKVVHEKDIDQMIDQFHILRSNDKDIPKKALKTIQMKLKRVFWE